MATWFFGPVAVLVYHLVLGNSRATSDWKQTTGATLFTVTGYAAGWILASFLLMRISVNPHPLLILGIFFVTPLVVVLLVFRFPGWVAARGLSFGRWLSGTVLTEVILLCFGFGILFFLTMLGTQRVFTTLPGVSSPFFLGLMSAEAIIGGTLMLPLVYWMTRRGYAGWPFSKAASGDGAVRPRRAWQPLLVSIAVMVGLVAVTVMQMA